MNIVLHELSLGFLGRYKMEMEDFIRMVNKLGGDGSGGGNSRGMDTGGGRAGNTLNCFINVPVCLIFMMF